MVVAMCSLSVPNSSIVLNGTNVGFGSRARAGEGEAELGTASNEPAYKSRRAAAGEEVQWLVKIYKKKARKRQ